jgi:hypothetical protein
MFRISISVLQADLALVIAVGLFYPFPLALADSTGTPGPASANVPEEWTFLDNGTLRIGVNRSAGGAIGLLSESGRSLNYLDTYDLGRYLQQSWYGTEDGSNWNGKPWRWNPVQAGGWEGAPAELLDFQVEENTIRASSHPRHWASGELLRDVTLSQVVRLEKNVLRVTYTMSYSGTVSHPAYHQELPALFVHPSCSQLHFIPKGETTPTRVSPGWPNQTHDLALPWVAYLDEGGRGIGMCVPGVSEITCYRFAGDAANRDKAACSYVAPVKTMAITPGFTHTYEVYLTLGNLAEIRHRFAPYISPTP